MHPTFFICPLLLGAAISPAFAQSRYEIVKEGQVHVLPVSVDRPGVHVALQFSIRTADGQLVADISKEEIVIEEDGRRVTELEMQRPGAVDPLTIMLVLDVSGSMTQENKLPEAKTAARLFLDSLHPRVNCGLILFDHQLRVVEVPRDRNRDLLRKLIEQAPADGGTAYLDAVARAIELLRHTPGRKAVLLLTDGLDLNSRTTLRDVIREAERAAVPIYTLGVGEPGQAESVHTVLVLDRSGSMALPAQPGAKTSKMIALQRAAGRFVEGMRPGAQTALLPFGSRVEMPTPFVASKEGLKRSIGWLQPEGETALFDAVIAAVDTLEAAQVSGKRAVVAFTDGIDNRSRRRAADAIERAREAKTPVHILGLGRPGELDEKALRRLAEQTRGSYHHAQNEEKLIAAFEALSTQLYDDGFDQEALVRLAQETGGKFAHVRKAADLQLKYGELSEELQTTWRVIFRSHRPVHDGTSRGIDVSVMRQGLRISNVVSADYAVHGVVLPAMNQAVYLGLLAMLGALLALPTAIRRRFKNER
jgi:VWFA-related protein